MWPQSARVPDHEREWSITALAPLLYANKHHFVLYVHRKPIFVRFVYLTPPPSRPSRTPLPGESLWFGGDGYDPMKGRKACRFLL